MEQFYKQRFKSKASKFDMLIQDLENSEPLLNSKQRHSDSLEDEDYIKILKDLRKNNKETFTQRLKQIESSQEGSVPLNLAQIQYYHKVKSNYLKEIKMTAEYRGSHSPKRKRPYSRESEPLDLVKKIISVHSYLS